MHLNKKSEEERENASRRLPFRQERARIKEREREKEIDAKTREGRWGKGGGGKPAGRIVDFYLLSIWLIVSQFLRSGDLIGLNAVIEIVALLIGLS